MLAVYTCVTQQHDPRWVAVAAILCLVSAFTTVRLLQRANRLTGRNQLLWVAGTGCVSGFGIWATHFLAMIAYKPDLPTGFDLPLTALSLVVAIAITGVAFTVRVRCSGIAGRIASGMLFGMGVSTMHHVGMAGFLVAGRLLWSAGYIAASIAIGQLFGVVAMACVLRAARSGHRLGIALLIVIAICGAHFLGMAGVAILPDMSVVLPRQLMPLSWLAAGIGAASLAIVAIAIAGLRLETRDRALRTEMARMRSLADAAVEGLLIYGNDGVITANRQLATLTGLGDEDVPGRTFAALFGDSVTLDALVAQPDVPVEAQLLYADGTPIPVELVLHMVELAGRSLPAISVRDLRKQRQSEEQIRFLEGCDPLTGLMNRQAFLEQVGTRIAGADSGRRFAILCLDLDRFRQVNDLHGHAAGDALLKRFAAVVLSALGPDQCFARLGGDEFAILLPDIRGPRDANRVAQAVLDAVRRENMVSATPYVLSGTIGIALYPDDGIETKHLLMAAATALHNAKAIERGTSRFFRAEMGEVVRMRRVLEQDLHGACARNEMLLAYQPQMNVKSRQIIGFEALLRWNHPQLGQVAPDKFISIAEESGAIVSLGEWVLRRACRDATAWENPLTVAVNVSPIQINNPEFATRVHEILLDTGLPPSRLELEITETALAHDFTTALTTLRRLKTLGVRIAMDDFGTGYSSLYNLRAFPFDKLKIDRSFVASVDSNEQASTIVRAILGIGHGLGIPVLAEGVESSEELDFLEAEGCEEVQGYLLGQPMGLAALRHLTHVHGPVSIDVKSQAATPAKQRKRRA